MESHQDLGAFKAQHEMADSMSAQVHQEQVPEISREVIPAYDNQQQESDQKIEHGPEDGIRKLEGYSAEIKSEDEDKETPGILSRYWHKYRPIWHAILWLLVTAYFSKLENY